MNKKIIFILFLTILLGIAGYLYYRGGIFSKEILRVDILGPSTAKLGEEVEYTVEYQNNGNFVLQKAKLVFELPSDSLTEDGKTRFSESLPDIRPGQKELMKFKGRLLGKDQDSKTAKVSISYTPEKITAQYESISSNTTKLDASNLSLDIDAPENVQPGGDFEYSIKYASEVDYPLENLSIKVVPVSGLTVSSAEPKSLDNAEWRLPTLTKGQEGQINIKAQILSGSNIKLAVSIGKWRLGQFTVIKEADAIIKVFQPQLSVWQQVNGVEDYTASLNEGLYYQIFIKNTGSDVLDSPYISVKLDTLAFDLSSVKVDNGGIFQRDGNIITWDSLPPLGTLQERSVGFTINTRSDWSPAWGDNEKATISNEVNIYQSSQEFSIDIAAN